jgi:hypothetical protein
MIYVKRNHVLPNKHRRFFNTHFNNFYDSIFLMKGFPYMVILELVAFYLMKNVES